MLQRFRDLSYQRQVLIVYIFAIFMTIIDGTMVNVALPSMAKDFNTIPQNAEFVAIGYLLAMAATIPAAGWLADRFGTRKVLLSALVLFVGASVLCALSATLGQLIATRVLQGVGGGLLAPVGSTIVFRAFPQNERATAAAAVMSVAVTGPAIGPVLGGFLVDQVSWHWIFLINVPIGAVAMTLAWVSLRHDAQDDPGRLDIAGLVLSAVSISSLLYALTRGARQGWGSTIVVVTALVGVVGLVSLVLVERRVRHPMLALRLFEDGLFRTVNASASLLYAGFFGFLFVLPIYLQELQGLTALESGLTTAPQALGILLVSLTISKRAYQRIGPQRLLVVFGLIAAAITCSFFFVGTATPPLLLAAVSFVRGVAMGLVFIAIQTAVYATTSVADTGRATSLFNTQRQVAYATGVAVAASVLSALHPAAETYSAAQLLPGFKWAFLAVGLIMVPGALWAWFIDDDDDHVRETRGLATAVVADVD